MQTELFTFIIKSLIGFLVLTGMVIIISLQMSVEAATKPIIQGSAFTKITQTTSMINGDSSDIYFPDLLSVNHQQDSLPIALLLQGANVDKSNYSRFANLLARYGFIVVVPNHQRRFPPIPVIGKKILLPEEHQLNHVLDYMKTENENIESPLFGSIDLDRLVLIGHSMGGLVGLNAIQNHCAFPLCFGRFTRPSALVGGVFYGTNLRGHFRMKIHPIANEAIPIALIQGTMDGISTRQETEATYQNIQDSPKALITIFGANHYGIADANNPANPPGIPSVYADPIEPNLDQTRTIESIARWSGLFLRGYVMHDPIALEDLTHPAANDYETVILNSG